MSTPPPSQPRDNDPPARPPVSPETPDSVIAAAGAPTVDATRPASSAGEGAGLGEEREVWRGRMSWKNLAGQWFLWGAGTLLLIWLWWRLRTPDSGAWFGWLVLIVILGAAAAMFVRGALRVYGTHYRLTSQRLFIERGILSRTTDQTELYRVDDVRTHQSLLNRVFGVGDVELVAPSDPTQPSIRIVGIEGPAAVAEHVRTQSRALRMKRSLFVEQM